MSRFLVFSDLHLHLWHYRHRTSKNGLDDQVSFLHRLATYARENDIQTILFCGDFFHTHGNIKTEVLQSAYHTLDFISKGQPLLNFVWLVGNHDQADRAGRIHSLDFLRQFGSVIGTQSHTGDGWIELPGMPPIFGLNYTENTELLGNFLKSVPESSIVLMHQGVSGVEVNSKGFTLNEILKPEMIPDHITHAFAGHYHSFKRVSDKLTIPGAPMQHNWGDAGERRGFLDVMIDGSDVHIKHVDGQCLEFIKVPYKEAIKFNKSTGDFIKVVDTPASADLAEVRKLLFGMGVSTVEFEYEEENKEVVDAEEFDSFDKMFSDFTRQSKIEGRKLEVGRDVMNESYEAIIR